MTLIRGGLPSESSSPIIVRGFVLNLCSVIVNLYAIQTNTQKEHKNNEYSESKLSYGCRRIGRNKETEKVYIYTLYVPGAINMM